LKEPYEKGRKKKRENCLRILFLFFKSERGKKAKREKGAEGGEEKDKIVYLPFRPPEIHLPFNYYEKEEKRKEKGHKIFGTGGKGGKTEGSDFLLIPLIFSRVRG